MAAARCALPCSQRSTSWTAWVITTFGISAPFSGGLALDPTTHPAEEEPLRCLCRPCGQRPLSRGCRTFADSRRKREADDRREVEPLRCDCCCRPGSESERHGRGPG